jgi:ferritin-like metal-binding protein YciE
LLIKEAASLLEATFREEKAADRKLIEVATKAINIEAAQEKA